MNDAEREGDLPVRRVWWDGSESALHRRAAAADALGLPREEEGSAVWDRLPEATTLADLEAAACDVLSGAPVEWALRRVGATP